MSVTGHVTLGNFVATCVETKLWDLSQENWLPICDIVFKVRVISRIQGLETSQVYCLKWQATELNNETTERKKA